MMQQGAGLTHVRSQVIMDSVMCHLRVDFSGRGELADRQQKLGILMSRLRKASRCLSGNTRTACSCRTSA